MQVGINERSIEEWRRQTKTKKFDQAVFGMAWNGTCGVSSAAHHYQYRLALVAVPSLRLSAGQERYTATGAWCLVS